MLNKHRKKKSVHKIEEEKNTSHTQEESMPKAKSIGSAEFYSEMEVVLMSLSDKKELQRQVRKEIVDIAR